MPAVFTYSETGGSDVRRQAWWLWIPLFLMTLNLWLWNENLPFHNYAASTKKALVLQDLHGILLLVTISGLLLLGRILSQVKSPSRWALLNWLYLVGFGLASLLVNLVWQKSFTFSALLTVLMPMLRGASAFATSLVLAPLFLPTIRQLSQLTKDRLRWGIEVALLATTLFNVDLWGLMSPQSLVSYWALLMLGAVLPERRLHRWMGSCFIITGVILMMVMPLVSVTVHNDWSTANRFSTVTNGLLAVGVAELLPVKVLAREVGMALRQVIIPLVATATFPLSQQWLVILITNHGSNLLNKLILAGLLSLVVLIGSCCLSWLWIKVQKWRWIQRFANWSLPTSPTEARHQLRVMLGHRWPTVLMVALSYLGAFGSFLAMENSWHFSPNVDATYNMLTYVIATRQGMLWVTTGLIWLGLRLFWTLTQRYWLSLGTGLFLVVLWSVANRLKLEARNEPILPAELTMYHAYGNLLKMVSLPVLVVTFLGLLVMCGGIWYLERHYPVKDQTKWGVRLGFVGMAIVAFGSANWWNHPNHPASQIMAGFGDTPEFFNQLAGVRMNGPIVQFLNNLDVTVMNKPVDYNARTMQKVARRYQRLARQINRHRTNDLKHQTVIFNLSESFADPRRISGIKVTGDPLPNITRLKQTTTSGLMLSAGYGGGTANMEYMTLTGLATANFMPTLSTPYTQLVTFAKQTWSINQLFAKSVAIHPYVGVFYSRTTVYQKFGFDRFMYLGSRFPIKHQLKLDRSPYLSDQTSYANAVDQLNKTREGQFINLVTMQNHFPYDRNYYNLPVTLQVSATNGTPVASLADYVAGIHYTDQAVGQFIQKLDQLKQPVTVVFYGDHLPGIYANSFAEDGLKLHETDYFIYSNRVARAQGAKNLTHNTKYVAPNDFIAMVAEQTNSKVTPYLAFLTAAYHDLPVETMNTNGTSTASYQADPQFVSRQGKIISQKQFTKRQQQLFHDYQLIQYDLTAGKQYLFKFWQMK